MIDIHIKIGMKIFAVTGLVAHAAIYTHAWRTGNLLTATAAWSDALSAAAGPGQKVSLSPSAR